MGGKEVGCFGVRAVGVGEESNMSSFFNFGLREREKKLDSIFTVVGSGGGLGIIISSSTYR